MTVLSTYVPVRTAGNGILTAVPFSFRAFDDGDLIVSLVDQITNVKTLQVLGTSADYTVVVNTTSEGGVVNFAVAPPTGTDSLIERSIDFTQPTDIPNLGNVREEQLENEYDRSRMLDQQLLEELGRSFKFSVETSTNNPNFNFEVPDPISNGIWANNASATGIKFITLASLSAIALPLSTGIAVFEGSNSFGSVELSAKGDIVITNPKGIGGNPRYDTTVIDSNIAKRVTTSALASILSNAGSFLVGFSDPLSNYASSQVQGALAEIGGAVNFAINKGTYTGDGTSSNPIAGIGFQPTAVLVHRASGTTGTSDWTLKVAGTHTGTQSDEVTGGIVSDEIISLNSDGFTLGAGTHTNSNTVDYGFIAIKI